MRVWSRAIEEGELEREVAEREAFGYRFVASSAIIIAVELINFVIIFEAVAIINFKFSLHYLLYYYYYYQQLICYSIVFD